jgi:formylglycine-generating enzyme required for sulfatase activity
MRTIIRFILATLIVLGLSAFINKKKDKIEFTIKKLEKSLCEFKPGLYANAYEVSNLYYRIFLNDLKKSQEPNWEKHLPDSTGWIDIISYNDPLKEHYHNHPAYLEYPVSNITYEDALAYCEWLTGKYNSASKKKFEKVIFRLPTIEEWEQAALGGMELISYPMGPYLRRYDGHFQYNYQVFSEQNISSDEDGNPIIVQEDYQNPYSTNHNEVSIITTPVESYWPNGFGIYNICGNVAEMVEEKGICKGGSYKDFAYDLRIKEQGEYSKPAPWLGFRIFMEVVQ